MLKFQYTLNEGDEVIFPLVRIGKNALTIQIVLSKVRNDKQVTLTIQSNFEEFLTKVFNQRLKDGT